MFSNVTKDPQPSHVGNIIGQGTHLEGNITTMGNLRVEGKVTGGIHAKAKVVLSNVAFVQGNIVAQNAEVGGEVQGTIEVLELLVLKPTAILHGDIVARKLVFEEGAKFNGKCKMGDPLPQNASKGIVQPGKEIPLEIQNPEKKNNADQKKVGGFF